MDESDEDFKKLCASFFQRVKRTKDAAGERKAQKAVDSTELGSKSRTRQTVNKNKALASPGPGKRRRQLGSRKPLSRKQRAALESESVPPQNGDRGVLASDVPPECRNTTTEGAPSCDAQPSPSCPREPLPSSPKPRAAELVVQRMQQFKRAHPKRLKHASGEGSLEATVEDDSPEQPGEEPTGRPGNGLPATKSDIAVAWALQQELGQEQATPHNSSLEDRGLFFCQICQQNLSTMSVVGREQHVNRCLDEAEKAPRPSAPPVPECPICGKPCLTPKSRLSHLKQCAAKMEVSPQLLLQAVWLQAAQPQGTKLQGPLASSSHVGGLKQMGAPSKEPRKRQKVAHEAPSEDLLVAMALSRSEMEQDAMPAMFRLGGAVMGKTRLGAEKRGRKKKGPISPPQLLVQDPETTGRQLEDRVAQLLSEKMEVASTPPLPASRILETLDTASWCLRPPAGKPNFLWEGSALVQGWAPDAYYSARLCPSLRPQRPVQAAAWEPKPLLPPSSCSAVTPSPSASQREQQALQDLVELAREGLSSSQEASSGSPASSGGATGAHLELSCRPLTGFVLPSAEPLAQDGRALASMGRLLADFSAMVSNPHLSDVQLQMDNGDVLYAHQFVLYARCPLLMQYVNSEGFLAEEDGDLQVQRVLLSDVSTEAARAFLHYLYAAEAGLSPELAPDLSKLAHRFGVRELVHLCQCVPAVADAEGREQELQEGSVKREENFQELLRSMWEGEAEDAEDTVEPESQEEDREKVDDADMDEIYEFAATQRKLLREEAVVEAEERDLVRENSLDRVLFPGPQESPQAVDSPERERGEAPMEELGPASPSSPTGKQPFLSQGDPGLPETWHEPDAKHSRAQERGAHQQAPPDDLCCLLSQPPPRGRSPRAHLGGSSPPVPSSQGSTSMPPTQHSPSQQKRHRGDFTRPEEPLHEKGQQQGSPWECRHEGGPAEQSPSIDLTQWKPSPGGLRPQCSPSAGSRDNEVILLLDSDEELELELEQTKIKTEGRSVPEYSPKSCELFPIIDVDADPEDAQSSPARETEPPQEELWEDRGTPPLFHDPSESSPDEMDTESSWLVPATPLASSSHNRSSQTQISGLRSRTLREPVAQPRAPAQKMDRPLATKKSPVMVRQARSPAHLCPFTPGSPESRGQVRRRAGHHRKHCSPVSPHPDSGGLPDLPPLFQPPRCSPPDVATASEVVEVEDSEDEEKAASYQARSSPLLDGDPPIMPDCCWNVEPLSPIPIDHLNLERTGPLSASSPNGRAREARDSTVGHSPAPLSTTPIRGSCAGPRASRKKDPQAGSPGSSRPSFLNSSLWDDWDGEEQKAAELPVLAWTPTQTPSADEAQTSRGFETPKGANQKNLPPKVPITPMPRYSIMETPVLKKELDRFGVRPLPKRQMVLKLKEIFQYTHQTLESDSDISGHVAQLPLEAPHSQAYATVASEAFGVADSAQPETSMGLIPQRPKGSAKTKGHQRLRQQLGKDTAPLSTFPSEGAPPGPDSDAQLPASQESTATSEASADTSFSSHSSSGEFGTAFEFAGEDEDDEDSVSASQAAVQATATEAAVSCFIRSRPDLYRKVLQYQPLELAELQAELKQHGIRVATRKLLDFLDAHCITFTTAAARKTKRKGRRPGSKSKGRRASRPQAPSPPRPPATSEALCSP